MAVSNISDLARELVPYILPYIPTPTTSTSGGGSALGGTSGSYLSLTDWLSWKSSHENSSLNPHPQYLLSARQVLPGYGLTGGGALTADVTLAVDAVNDSSILANYGKVLKSTGTGGLTLAALQVNGAINTTGNIQAGSNVIFVNVAGSRVGINCAADPQFQLDVAGNIRAQGYIVGKHAIQLADALMICHYDGKEGDLTGEAAGHRGQVATLVGGITWQKGKFSKAVAIGEATTNMHGNPDFESGVTGWVSSGGSSIAWILDKSWLGKSSGKATLLASGYVYYPVTCVASTTYSYSAYLWSDVPASVNIQLSDLISSSLSSGTISIPAKQWTRVLFTGTTTATTARYFLIQNAGGSTATIYIDGCQVEQKPYTTPYTVGTRAACGIRYQADGNFDRAIGTVMFWVNLGGGNSAGTPRQIVRVDCTSNTLAILANTSGNLEYYWGTTASTASAGAISPNAWHHVALTNDGAGTLIVYIDGVQAATNANGATLGPTSSFGGNPIIDVGQYSGNGSQNMNGLLDELAITSTALSADAIKAVYESNAPVFAETSTFSFRIPKSTVWADENGLFVISDTGTPVLGAIAYTGGYSWGGQTLQAGDILMGTGASYAKWDQTASMFKVAGNIDAQSGSISGVLTIGTSGGIYQGTGTFASPTSGTGNGLKIYNSGGVGLIEAWGSAAKQWYTDSAGKFYAGAGSVTLDSVGLSLNAPTSYVHEGAVKWYSSGTQVGSAYTTAIAATNSALVLQSYPPANNTYGSVSMLCKSKNSGGTLSSASQIYLSANAPSTSSTASVDVILNGNEIERIYEAFDANYYWIGGSSVGGRIGWAFSAVTTTDSYVVLSPPTIAIVAGAHVEICVKASGGGATVTSANIAVGATSDFTCQTGLGGNDLRIVVNAAYVQVFRLLGANTYTGVIDVLYY